MTDRIAAAASARFRLRAGVALALVTALGLALSSDLPPPEVMAIPLFLVFFPALAWAQLPLMVGEVLERIPIYLGSIASILLLGFIALLLGVWGFDPRDVGFVWPPPGELAAWTLGITAAALALAWAVDQVEHAVSGGPHPILVELLPRTPSERGVFAVLSLVAGWGEEVAYRGYLPAALLLLVGEPWSAMAVAALGFGVLHSYQGGIGVVRTALIGFLLGVPVVLTGSIVPGVLAHALVDLIAGIVLAPRTLRKAGADAPDSADSIDPRPG